MRIIVENQQEKQIIESLCDIALRVGGIKNLKETQIILNAIEFAKKPETNERESDGEQRRCSTESVSGS